MKKLVLAALLAAAASTGCIISSGSDDRTITANWSFTHLATNSPGQCPHASDMAQIVAQPWDEEAQLTVGAPFVEMFPCDNGTGTAVLPDDVYRVWVEIYSGGQLFAQSDAHVIDTTFDPPSFDASFYDDGGYFQLSWDLIDKATQQRVSCKTAGIDSSGSVEIISTSIADSKYFKDDKFTCQDHFGTTDALLAGTYTISVNAELNNALVGDPTNFSNKAIAPNQVTDLGNIKIKVPVN